MKASPDLMMSALITHNNLISRAKATNFGHTLEQEGDSFTIMFHEAPDAVKFCLQVTDFHSDANVIVNVIFRLNRWPAVRKKVVGGAWGAEKRTQPVSRLIACPADR